MKNWPSKEKLDQVRKKLAKTPGSRMITNDFPLVDRMKRDLCAELIIYKKEHQLNQRELAHQLEISEALVSKLVRYRFDEFTIDRLVRYLENIGIRYTMKRLA